MCRYANSRRAIVRKLLNDLDEMGHGPNFDEGALCEMMEALGVQPNGA